MGWFSNFCGLGGSGIPQHVVDLVCEQHDEDYDKIRHSGEDPYLHWNDADQRFLDALKDIHKQHPHSTSLGEWITHVAGKEYFLMKKAVLQATGNVLRDESHRLDRYSIDYEARISQLNYSSEEEETKEEMMTSRAEGSPAMEHSGTKRKRHEEHGMEPAGHGNTPATGTEQAGFIQKYVPCNFPDKFTVKLKYVNSYTFRSAATAGALAQQAYIIWKTNSMNSIDAAVSGVFSGLPGSHPNQFNGVWKTLYGYYRVQQLEYRITCSNISNSQFVETAAPAFTGAGAVSDAICTLLPTQNSTDISTPDQQATWEQKQAHNIYLQARAPGSSKTIHTYHGTIDPEDFDIDPLTTAQDETWTSVANSPSTAKYLGLCIQPASQYTTALLLPEVIVQVFIEFFFTVQFAGYLPALRQAVS